MIDNRIRHTKESLLNALEQSLGVVTTACKSVGIHRSTFYDYYNNDEEFRQKVDDLNNVAKDFVESKMFENISNNDSGLIKFYLATKGKDRGYVPRNEIATDGMPTNFQIEIIDSTTEDKD